MKTIFRLVAPLALLAFFSLSPFASAAGTIPLGGDCTSNPTGCVSGLSCVPGDYGSVCSSSSSGYVPPSTVAPTSGGGINLSVVTPYSNGITNLINNVLVPVLMAIAFITFLWGVFKYFIWSGESDTERATGKKFVLWGIIGFVVIVSIWGLVALVGGFFSLAPGGPAPKPPTI